jgi:hypothetical protein
MKGNHHHRAGSRVRFHYRAADTRRGQGYNLDRSYRMRLEEEFDESVMGDLDALLKAEPGSEAAAAAALLLRNKRLQRT